MSVSHRDRRKTGPKPKRPPQRRPRGSLIYMDPALIERIDAYARALEAERPGVAVPRTRAILVLILRGLDEFDEKALDE